MTKHIDTLQKFAPHGERYRSAHMGKVTTFCHSIRGLHTADSRRFVRRRVSPRATPTRHSLLSSPHTDEC